MMFQCIRNLNVMLNFSSTFYIQVAVKISTISQEFCNPVASTTLEVYTIHKYKSNLYQNNFI